MSTDSHRYTTRPGLRRARRRRSRGFTLPEVLIVVTLMGTLAAVLSAAMTVTFRQAASTEGRANVARAESSIDTWLPADLASTDVNNVALPAVDLDPAAAPCTTTCNGIDLSGTNALQLAWTTTEPGPPPVTLTTRVQYQYIQVGTEWQLQRIVCVGIAPCHMNVVLHDLKGPQDPSAYTPNTVRPVWVMDVAVPTAVAGLELDDNARRIIVTIDGGGNGAGAGGGLNSIDLTAGGRSTDVIAADDFTVPSFVRAKSRCGGPVTLILDTSGSIGGDIGAVKQGATDFVEAFRGTPTQVQIVTFDLRATTIGPQPVPPAGSPSPQGWHRYIDMTDDAQVNDLVTAIQGIGSPYVTNWEDAFFRTFKEQDGTNAKIQPNRVVFFTDGIPTVDRLQYRGGGGVSIDYNAGGYTNSSSNHTNARNNNLWFRSAPSYGQEFWDRADVILDQHRSTDLIFVGVGSGLTSNQEWTHNPSVYANNQLRPGPVTTKKGSEILSYLLANGPSGQVPAILDNGEYANAETADFYLASNYTAFAAAMKASALKDCGGTLTVQTRHADTNQPIGAEFVYENPSYRDDNGNAINAEARRVTTSQNFRTGTFDFEISNGTNFFTVDIVPSELQTLGNFTPIGGNGAAGWSCRAGAADKGTLTPIAISGSTFQGFSVDVAANEAVSCTLKVRPS